MNNLKKFIGTTQSLLLIILLLVSMGLPTYASLHKGEYFIIHEKYEDAITTLEPFAAQNNPHALYLLSYIYLMPSSHHLNFQKGLALLEKAVSLNYAPAIDELAGLYLSGEGVEKNEEKALHYYLKGADAGYGPSQFNSGIMYKEGRSRKLMNLVALFKEIC
jgi:TPR repeat protein